MARVSATHFWAGVKGVKGIVDGSAAQRHDDADVGQARSSATGRICFPNA